MIDPRHGDLGHALKVAFQLSARLLYDISTMGNIAHMVAEFLQIRVGANPNIH